MAHITEKEILHLANLARIRLEPHEVAMLANEIEAILAYASSLKEVADKYQEAHPSVNCADNVLREDSVVRFDSRVLLEQSPQREEDYFIVPRIITRGE